MADQLTKRWIKSAADERAIKNGCYFDEAAATHAVEFFPRFLCHSKGKWAGKPFELLDWQRDDLIMPLYGWMRSNGTRRFRKAYVEIPKKNGKSTLAAGIGLYGLVGDGEPGAEVYSAANDQSQASIVHGEAINMVDASPELSSVLKVNRSSKTISFNDARSYYKALSSEAAGKEGLNAHVIIVDELHIWHGRKLWDALKYAFRARKQGLLFVITTAGDDLKSVCYEQHEYARGVIEGHVADDRFFGYIRAADKTDDWTAEETWAKANPSWGITIDPEEFAADVEEARRTPTTQATFRRYSLNIWSTATNSMLRMEDWNKCGVEFEPDDLAGLPCYGGLDLAKTRDMTAFTLAFPQAGKLQVLPYFWLPEDTIHDSDAPEEYRVWHEQGLLRATPGNVCDYEFVLRDICELCEQFDVRAFAFDPYNAEQLTQQIEESTGVPRFKFPQTIAYYNDPTTEFERLILGAELQHNKHPILSWQAGHVQAVTNANGDKRPVKPKHGDHRKIDGVVATIMAIGCYQKHGVDEADSVYEDRGIMVL